MSKKRIKLAFILLWLIPSYFFIGMCVSLFYTPKMEHTKGAVAHWDTYNPTGSFSIEEIILRIVIWVGFSVIIYFLISRALDIEERNVAEKSKTKKHKKI